MLPPPPLERNPGSCDCLPENILSSSPPLNQKYVVLKKQLFVLIHQSTGHGQ